jgi:hypothetical protein
LKRILRIIVLGGQGDHAKGALRTTGGSAKTIGY